MSFSGSKISKTHRVVLRSLIILVIASIAFPLSPAQAEAVRKTARQIFSFADTGGPGAVIRQDQDFEAQVAEPPSERAMRVAHLRLCPRRLSLYVGEAFTLAPLPLNRDREVVHGAGMTWDSKNPETASVSSWGEVGAVAPGHTVVTVQAGTARASVAVEVREGVRPVQSDLEWDLEHGQDCDDPEASQLGDSTYDVGSTAVEDMALRAEDVRPDFSTGRATSRDALKRLARPAALRVSSSPKSRAVKAAAGKKIPVGRVFPLIDPDGGDTYSAGAALFNNAVGSTRFGPQESSQESATKTRRQLGSYNYLFTTPVLSLGGRGPGVNLDMNYNSRLWNKDGTTMTFNYNKGWPAAGWTLGYGRVIKNYDNTATGNGSGTGASNAPGNRLLIQPDGARVHLQQSYFAAEGQWEWDTTDGTFIHMNNHDRLRYPNGSIVFYSEPNNRLVPTSIKNSNGDLITIAYRNKDSNFPYRWAIDYITDTLGRVIQFKYYGDSGYPVDAANGKPDDALAAILAPNIGGSGMRTLVKVEYQDITLKYNFGSLTVVSPGNDSILTVVKRVYYPQTGRGYLFSDYSSYGMARKISARKDMTGAGGTITDGTETAYTTYDYTTFATQSGSLNDSPQYTQRGEWWQAKTDNNGAADPNPSVYTYSRSTALGIETDMTTYPTSGALGQLSVVTKTDTTTGTVSSVEFKNGSGNVLRKTLYTYTTGPDGGTQVATIERFDEAGASTKVEYGYDTYGRVKNFYEYGYKDGGIFKIRRRTRYDYSNVQAHLDERLLRLLTQVRVYDGTLDNDNTNDILKSMIVYSYDDYAVKGGMENYGLISGTYPPNHDSAFDQNYTTRGNLTGTQSYSAFGPDVSTIRYVKYDIFGNTVEADVSCCQVKTAKFKDDLGNAPTYYSQPMSVINGRDGVVPFLKTKYQYDFNTGLVTSQTDANNLTTTFGYDSAWRLLTVNAASGAVTTTQFDKDANGNDQLTYSEKVSYTENGTSKVVTRKSWFDGAGRVLRSGSGAGATPTSYDMVAAVYDSMGRGLKQSNPYAGDASGNGSPLYWTQPSYDLLSRVTQVKLQDNQTISTSYTGAAPPTGATVIVTDQVGRQRKSETDGLGRLTKVIEQNPSTGLLDATNYQTTYSYDVIDKLTQVNQGNQLRTFVYDALGRPTSQATPEAGTVTSTYTDSSNLLKQTDARGVETHYKYDSLNRPVLIWYTGVGGNDAGTIRPALPSGVAATADVSISYNNYTSSQAGNGHVSSVTDQAGTESYIFDSLGRVQSKTRTVDARSYQTQYLYNAANQLTTLIYPSGKRVRMNHDTLGRMGGLDKVDSSGNTLSQYVTSVVYNNASQVTSVGLANGVSESYGYDAQRMQMTSQTATRSGSTLLSMSYVYQALGGTNGVGTGAGNSGQLVSISGTVNGFTRNQSFGYDNLGRLSVATGWGAWSRRYGYDRWGNRTGMWDAVTGGSQLQNVAIAQTGSVANNRISSVNGVTYSYDASGNVTNDGGHSYTYDGEGRQASVDSGATATNVYDASNWRVKKVSGGVATHYVWEGGQVIAEYNGGTGALISEYIYAGGRMVARDQGGVLRYYHQDRLSTRMITDSSGTVMGTEDHMPFGEEAGVIAESEKHRFTNYERDSESNTDYAINRQHQYANGRFMQADRLAGQIGNPQSLNRYSYSLNDPVNVADPLGLDPVVLIDGIDPLGVGGFKYGPNGVYGGYHGDLNLLILYKPVLRGYADDPYEVFISVSATYVGTLGAQKSDCENFVNYLMHAVNKPLADITQRLLGVRLAGMAKNELAKKANKLGVSGFKEKYIAGGQNGWAMVHIAGIAGAALAGARGEIDRQFREDRAQLKIGLDFKAMGMTEINYPDPDTPYSLDKFIAEKQAEIEDDHAGVTVGDILSGKVNGRLTFNNARIKIFNLLCDN